LKKSRNEDALLIGSKLTQANMVFCGRLVLPGQCNIVAVADGLGGHDDGHLASKIILSEHRRYIDSRLDEYSLSEILQEINYGIYSKANTRKQNKTMGASAAGIVFLDQERLFFSVSDCVIYQNNDALTKIFEPNRSQDGKKVMDTFGGMKDLTLIKPFIRRPNIISGNNYVLASDGLYDILSKEMLYRLLVEEKSPEKTYKSTCTLPNW
jgi:serine/threonine protein phosphatase PrpC